MGIQHSATISASLSPLGDACSRKDLTAIHEVLENIGYKDDDGVANEVLIYYYSPFNLFLKILDSLLIFIFLEVINLRCNIFTKANYEMIYCPLLCSMLTRA